MKSYLNWVIHHRQKISFSVAIWEVLILLLFRMYQKTPLKFKEAYLTLRTAEAYSELCQTCKMEFFTKVGNSF